MGKPSDQRLSARRQGKNERARVKRPFRGTTFMGGDKDPVTGADRWFVLHAGKKKTREAYASKNPANPWSVVRRFGRLSASTRDAQTPRKSQPGSPVGPVSGTAGAGPATHLQTEGGTPK